MDVHSHFQALGLKRGSSEGDMRKAYHKKALEYHPDRNPNGADIFKRIHVAYEALQKHYKSHGGIDFSSSTARYAAPTSSTNHTTAFASSRASEPLFSEEELFRDSGLGGVHSASSFFSGTQPRRYPHRPFRQSSSTSSSPPPDGPPMFSEAHAQAAQQHAQAHRGHRAPVSGYDPFHGDGESMDGFVSQAKHFADMEQRKARLAKTAAGSIPSAHPQNDSEKTEGNTTPSSSPPGRCPQGQSPRRQPPQTRPTATTSGKTSYTPCHQQLNDEWQAQRQHAQEIERARLSMEEAERAERKAKIDRETREEWARMTEEMEARSSAEAARVAQRDAIQRVQKQSETNSQLRGLQSERRELKRELFRRRMPVNGEIDRMSAQELFLMQQVLEEAMGAVSRSLHERLRPTATCCACTSARKESGVRRFSCSHADTCVDCGRTCVACPICGADNLDLMREE